MKTTLSPQQKKTHSYAKDRRNSYGERGANSRFAIRDSKLAVNRTRRRLENSPLHAVVVSNNEDILSQIDQAVRASGAEKKKFRKHADSPLELVVERKLLRRQNARDVASEPSPQKLIDAKTFDQTPAPPTSTGRLAGWQLSAGDVTWSGSAGGNGGRTNYSMSLSLTHLPTGMTVTMESPKGNYTRRRATAMRESMYQHLFAQLEQLVVRHLRISGLHP